MLNGVIRLALKYRGLVMLLAVVVMAYGSILATSLPVDVFPDLDRPRVVLLTECPGLSPAEVEALVAQPLETAILGASGVQAVRSQSSQGLAVVYVEFDWQTEARVARQTAQERLARAAPPDGAGTAPPGPRRAAAGHPPADDPAQLDHGPNPHRRPGPPTRAA